MRSLRQLNFGLHSRVPMGGVLGILGANHNLLIDTAWPTTSGNLVRCTVTVPH